MKRRFFMCLLSAVFVLAFFCSVTNGDVSYAAQTFTLNYPTQEQIKQRYKQLGIDFDKSTSYTENYSITAPYAAGNISQSDRQNALNAVNFCRYIAGLPDDVVMTDEYNTLAQAASLVLLANGSLSHSPQQPAGMPESLYKTGADGAGGSNIAKGYTNLARSVVFGYIEDSDKDNISLLGHRRWLLSPALKTIGFGMTDIYSAAYVKGTKRGEAFAGDYVAWPPKNMPIELYKSHSENYAFSVVLGEDYDEPDISKVTVDISSKKQNKSWHLTKNSTGISEYLTVNNSNYGGKKCIIFNVGMFSQNDTVTVKINGIYKNGVSKPISYTVDFFSIYHDHSYTSKITKEPTCNSFGEITYTCECGDSYTKNIAKKEHSYTERKVKEESCTESGLIIYTCKYCNDNYSKPISALGHKFGEYEIIKWPTAESDGIAERICARCGLKEQHRAVLKDPAGTSSNSSDSEASDVETSDSEASDSVMSDSETIDGETSDVETSSSSGDNEMNADKEVGSVTEDEIVIDDEDTLLIVEESSSDVQVEEKDPTESEIENKTPALVIIIVCIFSTVVLFVIFLLGKKKQ